MPRPEAVVVSLNGGVGNQLFQYAAGLGLASTRGVRLEVLPGRAAGTRSVGVADLLDVPAPVLTPYERFLCGVPSRLLSPAPPIVRRVATAIARRASRYREIHQSLMQMADPVVDIGDGDRYLHLRGLFQHPSYYDAVLDDIVTAMLDRLRTSLDVSSGDGVVAMHFRRGDYLLHGYDLPFSFQEEALAAIAERSAVSRVLVMSDDHDFAVLAAEHFATRGFTAHAAPEDATRSELGDFCALASAQHLVMSNSTFVWWAGVLGDRLRRDDRVVVCPSPWMPMRSAGTIPSAALDLSRRDWLLHPVRS